MTNPLAIAQDVIALEIAGLTALKNALNGQFPVVVEMLSAAKGRVVVTGMGKSGHVARKIAATFASTGAPAMFVHPGEASHGDLGMVSRNDVILALSKSGETPSLAISWPMRRGSRSPSRRSPARPRRPSRRRPGRR